MSITHFDLDAYLEETKRPEFTVTFAGEVWTFQNFLNVPLNLIAKLQGENEFDGMTEILKFGLGKAQHARFEKKDFPVRAIEKLFTEWRNQANEDLGKEEK